MEYAMEGRLLQCLLQFISHITLYSLLFTLRRNRNILSGRIRGERYNLVKDIKKG